MPDKYQSVRSLVIVQSKYRIRTESSDEFENLYLDEGSFMSRGRAHTEAGFGELSGSGLGLRPK